MVSAAADDYPELVVLKGGQAALEEIDNLRADVADLREANTRLRNALYGTPHVTLDEGSGR